MSVSSPRARRRRAPDRVPKILGSDVELGNLILGRSTVPGATCREACRAILAEIDGVPARSPRSTRGRAPASCAAVGDPIGGPDDGELAKRDEAWRGWGGTQGSPSREPTHDRDFGRVFLAANGSSTYEDLSHAELASPEVTSARDHVAVSHAMLRIARRALLAANERQPPTERIVALANNSDGKGNSYGSHLSVLMTRRAWRDMIERRMDPSLFFLMSFQVSGIVLTGQGKVGTEGPPNGHTPAPFQISQRADFFTTMIGPQTSTRRPLINSRDESHCGAPALARLHVIFFDHCLMHVAGFLKAGLMQLIVAMIEARRVDRRLVLRSPLDALARWSRDPDLRARARLVTGQRVTAVEHQLLFLERAHRFVDSGECGDHVPEAGQILRVWEDTLDRLETREFDDLARRLDWVAKRGLLERAMSSAQLDWTSPEIRYLDQMYGSLDENEGLYWACERDGAVERMATEERIEHLVHEPPDDTRAWTRAMLLRTLPRALIEEVDWGFVRVRRPGRTDPESVTLWLPSPHSCTRAEMERHFTFAAAAAAGASKGGTDHAGARA